jgi:hypothetical protein
MTYRVRLLSTPAYRVPYSMFFLWIRPLSFADSQLTVVSFLGGREHGHRRGQGGGQIGGGGEEEGGGQDKLAQKT